MLLQRAFSPGEIRPPNERIPSYVTFQRESALRASREDTQLNAPAERIQIGETAERLGISPRTIKYYEEFGLIQPEERSPGGFRLYGPADVRRLEMILRIKAMGFSLSAIRELLSVRDAAQEATREEVLSETMNHLLQRASEVDSRIEKLGEDLHSAQSLREELRNDISLCESRLRELKQEET